jgi:hypothetical protein
VTRKVVSPTETLSPALRTVGPAIWRPLTKVPLVDPRSWMWIWPLTTMILACRRETMSSTRTMSSSLDRPITISPFSGKGNSPPWYLPEMKRSA